MQSIIDQTKLKIQKDNNNLLPLTDVIESAKQQLETKMGQAENAITQRKHQLKEQIKQIKQSLDTEKNALVADHKYQSVGQEIALAINETNNNHQNMDNYSIPQLKNVLSSYQTIKDSIPNKKAVVDQKIAKLRAELETSLHDAENINTSIKNSVSNPSTELTKKHTDLKNAISSAQALKNNNNASANDLESQIQRLNSAGSAASKATLEHLQTEFNTIHNKFIELAKQTEIAKDLQVSYNNQIKSINDLTQQKATSTFNNKGDFVNLHNQINTLNNEYNNLLNQFKNNQKTLLDNFIDKNNKQLTSVRSLKSGYPKFESIISQEDMINKLSNQAQELKTKINAGEFNSAMINTLHQIQAKYNGKINDLNVKVNSMNKKLKYIVDSANTFNDNINKLDNANQLPKIDINVLNVLKNGKVNIKNDDQFNNLIDQMLKKYSNSVDLATNKINQQYDSLTNETGVYNQAWADKLEVSKYINDKANALNDFVKQAKSVTPNNQPALELEKAIREFNKLNNQAFKNGINENVSKADLNHYLGHEIITGISSKQKAMDEIIKKAKLAFDSIKQEANSKVTPLSSTINQFVSDVNRNQLNNNYGYKGTIDALQPYNELFNNNHASPLEQLQKFTELKSKFNTDNVSKEELNEIAVKKEKYNNNIKKFELSSWFWDFIYEKSINKIQIKRDWLNEYLSLFFRTQNIVNTTLKNNSNPIVSRFGSAGLNAENRNLVKDSYKKMLNLFRIDANNDSFKTSLDINEINHKNDEMQKFTFSSFGNVIDFQKFIVFNNIMEKIIEFIADTIWWPIQEALIDFSVLNPFSAMVNGNVDQSVKNDRQRFYVKNNQTIKYMNFDENIIIYNRNINKLLEISKNFDRVISPIKNKQKPQRIFDLQIDQDFNNIKYMNTGFDNDKYTNTMVIKNNLINIADYFKKYDVESNEFLQKVEKQLTIDGDFRKNQSHNPIFYPTKNILLRIDNNIRRFSALGYVGRTLFQTQKVLSDERLIDSENLKQLGREMSQAALSFGVVIGNGEEKGTHYYEYWDTIKNYTKYSGDDSFLGEWTYKNNWTSQHDWLYKDINPINRQRHSVGHEVDHNDWNTIKKTITDGYKLYYDFINTTIQLDQSEQQKQNVFGGNHLLVYNFKKDELDEFLPENVFPR
ncbi:hypothetical protein [Ureaplasma zalophigenitalium]|uniref:Uncharacterized protein n=1 Tax=Ureaplasma zalophigenitalium TaxID=907723 RepID=A0ABT3BP94_9BACT|nr:hypothetical protein [Ureaplasma zalophigenitalium]MCV3754060.1 hypothetical protein [Ureaplasma zalophigenitalium]